LARIEELEEYVDRGADYRTVEFTINTLKILIK
jgi:hypothetical protein